MHTSPNSLRIEPQPYFRRDAWRVVYCCILFGLVWSVPVHGAGWPWRVDRKSDRVQRYGWPVKRGETAWMLDGWTDSNGVARQNLRQKFQRYNLPGKRVRITYIGQPGADALSWQELEYIRNSGEQIVQYFKTRWGWRVRQTFYYNILLYTDMNEFRKDTGAPKGALGMALVSPLMRDHGELVFFADRRNPNAWEELEATILHEMFHCLSNHCYGNFPISVEEGVAEWISLRLAANGKKLLDKRNREAKGMAKFYLTNSNGGFIKTYMNCKSYEAWEKEFNSRMVGYTLAEQLVDYFMADAKRTAFLVRTLHGAAGGADTTTKFAQLMDANYPGGLPKLEKDWHAWMQVKFQKPAAPVVAAKPRGNPGALMINPVTGLPVRRAPPPRVDPSTGLPVKR
jgi:hypothetical protein